MDERLIQPETHAPDSFDALHTDVLRRDLEGAAEADVPEPAGTPAEGQAPALEDSRSPRHGGASVSASIQSLMITIVIAVFVITFSVQAFQIPSESMENTLLIGDYLLVDKVHYSGSDAWPRLLPYSEVARGDVVVFRYPIHPSQHFVKRVVGLPGDRIRLRDKQAWVNGRPLPEPYLVSHSQVHDPYRDDFPNGEYPQHVNARWWDELSSLVQGDELVVPQGKYFVLGDNRDESLDSRYWGLVPRENIVGRPLIIYFSVGSARGPFPEAEAAADQLSRFAQAFTSVVREVRWRRTFRLVH